MISYELQGPKTLKEKSSPKRPDVYQQYDELISNYVTDYEVSKPYIRCGKTDSSQGWIIHLSVTRVQILELLSVTLPLLVSANVSFKIPGSLQEALSIIDGSWSYIDLGKVVCIFPASEAEGVRLAQALIDLTRNIRGPHIPTDYHLGSVVYTRYGSFENGPAVGEGGNNTFLIQGSDQMMLPDIQKIPFEYPVGLTWPFARIKEFTPKIAPPLICGKFRYVKTLKYDAKGNVIKALYFKNLISIRTCVLKQGRRNLMMDDWGRDIVDRLQYQFDLLRSLPADIPTARANELIKDEDSVYLAIEYVKGESLESHLMRYLGGSAWIGLNRPEKAAILRVLLKLLDVVRKLHSAGIVHRDLSPGNFIVAKGETIYMIDLELAWSIKEGKPDPPFVLGTPGFISPQQMILSRPAFEDDIYGLGALMITFFTGLVPTKFDRDNPDMLKTQLLHFIGSPKLVKMIVACLEKESDLRPSLGQIISCCTIEWEEVTQGRDSSPWIQRSIGRDLSTTIQKAINGLAGSPLSEDGGLWLSKQHGEKSAVLNRQVARFVQPGLFSGVAGVMYALANASKLNYDLSACRQQYDMGFNYLLQQFQTRSPFDNFGLASGYSGIGIAINAGLQAGMVENIEWSRQLVCGCFSNIPPEFNLMNGKAGFGLAALESREILGEDAFNAIIGQVIREIVSGQKSDGSWPIPEIGFSQPKLARVGFMTGSSGILYFLLRYFEHTKDRQVIHAITRGLEYIISEATRNGKIYNWYGSKKRKILNPWLEFGLAGIIRVFVLAYAVLGNAKYKEVTGSFLSINPQYIVGNTLSIARGLAGVGSVYLDGHKIFGDQEWLARAEWIAEYFNNSYISSADRSTVYWLSDESDIPCSSLLYGNAGILNFLIRFTNHDGKYQNQMVF